MIMIDNDDNNDKNSKNSDTITDDNANNYHGCNHDDNNKNNIDKKWYQ